MSKSTGIVTKWVLVYSEGKVLIKQYNEAQETTCIYDIETFDTEQEMQDRIVELGLTDLPVDEEV